MPEDTQNPDSVISLRQVTKESLREITSLSVAPHQQDYVATNAFSIAQAYFHPEAWFRGIYADDTPVGFVMLEDWTGIDNNKNKPIMLWRFMIDQRYQGLGYGRKALLLIIDHVRSTSTHDYLLTSYCPGPHTPEGFYRRLGFEPTGDIDDGEIVARLNFV